MKPGIHPKYAKITVTCACGNVFETRTTLGGETLSVDLCAACHPFYTGKQKLMDAAGRIERFRRKYGKADGAEGETPAAGK
jgi:large subunit ribosomal protein L31